MDISFEFEYRKGNPRYFDKKKIIFSDIKGTKGAKVSVEWVDMSDDAVTPKDHFLPQMEEDMLDLALKVFISLKNDCPGVFDK